MNRIKQLRLERDMSQEDLSKVLNVKRAVISKYELEQVPLSGETIMRLASFFDVSTDYLLGMSEDSASPKVQRMRAQGITPPPDIPERTVKAPIDILNMDIEALADNADRQRELLNDVAREFYAINDLEQQTRFLQLAKLYRGLNYGGQERVIESAEDIHGRAKYRKKARRKSIPFFRKHDNDE